MACPGPQFIHSQILGAYVTEVRNLILSWIEAIQNSKEKKETANEILRQIGEVGWSKIGTSEEDVKNLQHLLHLIYLQSDLPQLLQTPKNNLRSVDPQQIPKILRTLAIFRSEMKFPNHPAENSGPDDVRQLLSMRRIMDSSIDEISLQLASDPSIELILELFRKGLRAFDDIDVGDTEDREQVCKYYMRIREIIGFESTEGILNEWLYGF